ncbi:MAG TPA: acyl-CoA thioesterase domain-containing protein [Mycobacteriales bacterium]|nr:acyl-CoA thioesterase domain-containing protein [Mycobacteriales bacterium]
MRSAADQLALEPMGGGHYRGRPAPTRRGRLFGGLVMGQATWAAAHEAPGRAVLSLRTTFLEGGDLQLPIDYAVRPLGADLHLVVAAQEGRPILEQAVRTGPPPPAAPPAADPWEPPEPPDLHTWDADSQEWFVTLQAAVPVDIRFPDLPARVRILRGERPAARQVVHLRVRDALPDDPQLHAAALAFLSDVFLLATGLPPHGLVLGGPRSAIASSLNHGVVLHAPVRADDWLRYEMTSSWAGGGRVLCHGALVDRAGVLVASTFQEGVVRRPRIAS